MIFLRSLMRKIRCRPLGSVKRVFQAAFYGARGLLGNLIFFLLRVFRLIEPIAPWDKASIKKILIIKPERIGDTILATPAFQALRETFPDAYICLIASSGVREIIEGNLFVDEMSYFKEKGIRAVIKEFDVIRKLRNKRFDLAVILYPTFWCNLTAFLSGAAIRIGYDFHGSGFFLTKKLPYNYQKVPRHEVELNLDVARLVGADIEKKELFVSIYQEAEEFAEKFMEENGLKEKNFALIHPGAYEEYIRWNAEGFAQIADRLMKERKMKVVLLGGPGEEGLVGEIISLTQEKPIIAQGFSLSEAVSLIKRARIFIGNSTGTMHIAAALKIPVVAIFANSHPLDSWQKWGPFGEGHIVVHKDVGCIDCQPSDCGNFRCREAITVSDVFGAIRAQLNKPGFDNLDK